MGGVMKYFPRYSILLVLLGFSLNLHAATITVNTTRQCNSGAPEPLNCFDVSQFGAGDGDGLCSLGEAISAAFFDHDVDGCHGVGAYGNDTILLQPGATYTLSQVDRLP